MAKPGQSWTSKTAAEAGRLAWALHPEKRNPIKQCVLCLYRIGFGCRRIGNITNTNRSLVMKWVRKAGVERSQPKHPNPLVSQSFRTHIENVRKQKVIERRRKLLLGFRRWEAGMHLDLYFRATPKTKEEIKAAAREYYYRNRERLAERNRQKAIENYRKNKNNPEWIAKKKAATKRWRQDHPEWRERWLQRNQWWYEEFKKRKKEAREHLSDDYVRSLMADKRYTSLSKAEIPDELVELHRLKIKLIRELKRKQ
jgi:hypothetical protein